MAYYCTRQTGRTDSKGNKEECSGEIDKSTNKCDTCGAKSN